tara:strand:- start:360 stop:854 length:495 start_codon:yes stop_codon:yes gene_type:complete
MAKNGFSMSNRVVPEELIGTVTATAADCGKVYVVETTADNVQLNLPTLAAAGNGWNCTVQTVADPTNAKTVKIVSADSSLVYGGVLAAPISGAAGDNPTARYFKSGGATNITLASGSTTGGQGKGFMGSSVTITACVMDGFTSVWAVEGNLGTSGSDGHTTPFS